ncbi:MAG: L,D-transpeptidase [Hyphomicrobium sp.]
MLRTRVVAMACFGLAFAGPFASNGLMAEPAAAPATSPAALAATVAPAAAPASEAKVAVTTEGTLDSEAPAAVAEPAPAPAPAEAAPTNSAPGEAAKPADAPDAAKAAAAPPAPPADPTLTVSIDLATQRMTVSENGSAKYTWPISSGTAEFPTPRGTFRPQWTAKMWYSRKYDNAPMPHAVFIHGGVAIHATYHTGALGRPASHGCIRLAPGNAATFYKLVNRHGMKLTRVSVYGTPKWRAPAIAKRTPKPAPRYASNDDSGWFFGGSNSAAYNDGYYVKPRRTIRRVPQGYSAYGAGQPRVVRRYQGPRTVYVQRPPRRVYYYNNY